MFIMLNCKLLLTINERDDFATLLGKTVRTYLLNPIFPNCCFVRSEGLSLRTLPEQHCSQSIKHLD